MIRIYDSYLDQGHSSTAFLVASLLFIVLVSTGHAHGSQADLGDGTNRNPVLFADYSDPDVIRVGADYYLVASSFHFMPGLPILKSHDVVNWTIIGHLFPRLDISPAYSMIGGDRYGKGAVGSSHPISRQKFLCVFPHAN
jgi:Glycosyl hydrolases family 43